MNNELSLNVYKNIRETVLTAKNKVYSAVNFAMVEAYWSIGKPIADVQGERAEYGNCLIRTSGKLIFMCGILRYR